jgi:hypothetical protein
MATIQITGIGAPLSIPTSTVITVDAFPVGATSYLWEFEDIPEGSAAVFADPSAQQTTFTVDVEGTYLIRLTVDGTDVEKAAAAAPFFTTEGEIRIPAAGETFEADALKGWARALQAALKIGITALQTAQGLASIAWKGPVRLTTNMNVPLTGPTPLNIDGLACVDGDRVLLRNQTDPAENGVYDFTDQGASYTLTRAEDADTPEELAGATVHVTEGTAFIDRTYQQNAEIVTVDVTPQVWVLLGAGQAVTIPSGVAELLNDAGTRILRWTDGGNDYEVELGAV